MSNENETNFMQRYVTFYDILLIFGLIYRILDQRYVTFYDILLIFGLIYRILDQRYVTFYDILLTFGLIYLMRNNPCDFRISSFFSA